MKLRASSLALVHDLLQDNHSVSYVAKLCVRLITGEPFDLTIGNTATIGRRSDNTICLSAPAFRASTPVRCHNGYNIRSSISAAATAPLLMTSGW
jgi:hypothetical protein